MPSTSIQARINAFESNARNSNGNNKVVQEVASFAKPQPSPSPSPPNLGRKTSLIDLKDWVVDDGPHLIDATGTPTQEAFSSVKTANGNANASRPLVDLNATPSKPKPKPKPANLSASLGKKPQPPPPVRRSSYASLKSLPSTSPTPSVDSLTVEYAHRYPPPTVDLSSRGNAAASHAPSSSISSFHSVSLSSDTDPSTPGSLANFIATFPAEEGSRLLRRDADSISLTESYEEVSTSCLASPVAEHLLNLSWEKASPNREPVPPKLPQRPGSIKSPVYKSAPSSHSVSRATSASDSTSTSPVIRPSSSSATLSSANTPPYTPRRSAPPPPSSRTSDRSSIQSNLTTQSFSSSSNSYASRSANPSSLSLKIRRPTPVPLSARKRYEAVFYANIFQRRKLKQDDMPPSSSPGEAKGRRTVGWRGMSVDLVTGDGITSINQSNHQLNNINEEDPIGSDERLEGAIIKLIWKRSGLKNARLAEIWNECDPFGHGALSMEDFVKGMWRIDEELRRAHTQALRSTKSLNHLSSTYHSSLPLGRATSAPKIPPRTKSRDILR